MPEPGLSETEFALLNDLYENSPCGFHSLNASGTFIRMNNTELNWLGYPREEIIGRMNLGDILTPQGRKIFQQQFDRIKVMGVVRDIELDYKRKNGTFIPVLVSATASFDESGQFVMSRSIVYDLTYRKAAEEERERLIKELQAATNQVRMLRGLLPICSYCKRIRNENNEWESIEVYIRDRSAAEFSHGICPGCVRHLSE